MLIVHRAGVAVSLAAALCLPTVACERSSPTAPSPYLFGAQSTASARDTSSTAGSHASASVPEASEAATERIESKVLAESETGDRALGSAATAKGSIFGCPWGPWTVSQISFPAAGGSGTLTNLCGNEPAFLSPKGAWVTLPGFVWGAKVTTVRFVVAANREQRSRNVQIMTGGLLANGRPAAVTIYQAGR